MFDGRAIFADLATDGTTGAAGAIGKVGQDFPIPHTFGTRAGANLFHSFSRFDLVAGESATFSGPADIANVLARVTGGAASAIDGRINSTIAGANLFLINPSGILFGPNATLNVGGSFVATTANSVALGQQGRFDATRPADDVLTSAPVSAFGFLGPTPAAITVRGSFLNVKTGNNLALLGGDITLREGGSLAVPGGTLHLASVRSGGTMALDIRDRRATAGTAGFSTLGNITTVADANRFSGANVGNPGGGRLVIRAGRLVANRAQIQVRTVDGSRGDGIDIETRELVTLASDTALSITGDTDLQDATVLRIATPSLRLNTGGSINFFTAASAGRAGRAELRTPRISMSGGGQIQTSSTGGATGVTLDIIADSISLVTGSSILTSSQGGGAGGAVRLNISGALQIQNDSKIASVVERTGAGGAVVITAGSVELKGDPRLALGDSAGIVTATDATASGPGGDVSLAVTGALSLLDGATIQTSTAGASHGGNIAVAAGSLAMSTNSQIGSTVVSGASGVGGKLTIEAGGAITLARASILSETQGSGPGGDLTVQAAAVTLMDRSSIGANAFGSTATGLGGAIRLTISGAVQVLSGSQITRTANGLASGGDLYLSADSLKLSGRQGTARSGIGAETSNPIAGGAGANVFLAITGAVEVLDGALISLTTSGPGSSGDLQLDAGSLTVSGKDSGITGQTLGKLPLASRGGDLHFNIGGAVEVLDGGNITANSFGPGNGGDIAIAADTLRVSPGATGRLTGITTQTGADGNAGDLSLAVEGRLELADGARLSTATNGSGRGGDLSIVAGEFFATGLGSAVSAQTTQPVNGGPGGEVQISIDGTLQLAAGATITAASQGSGNGGSVSIDASAISISGANAGISTETLALENAGNGGVIHIRAGDLNIAGEGAAQVGISAETFGSGLGGTIDLNLNRLTLTESASISTRSVGLGNAGSITVSASDAVSLFSGGKITATLGDVATTQLHIPNIDVSAPSILIAGTNSTVTAATTGTGSAGSISLTGEIISVDFDAAISSESTGLGNAGRIDITASGGFFLYGGARVTATVGTVAKPELRPRIGIRSPMIVLSDGRINASTSGTGLAGDITLEARGSSEFAKSVELFGNSSIAATTSGAGEGGSITIDAVSFDLKDRAVISASTSGAGAGGNVIVRANRVNLKGVAAGLGAPGIFATSDAGADAAAAHGKGGSIDIAADTFTMRDNVVISASTFSSGRGGDVRVVAKDSISLLGGNLPPLVNNLADNVGIFANSFSVVKNAGQAGAVTLRTGDLTIASGMLVSTSTQGPADAGPVRISAERFTIDGRGSSRFTGVFAAAISEKLPPTLRGGKGGSIHVEAGKLGILDGAGIAASTLGSGRAGNLIVRADEAEFTHARPIKLFGPDGATILFAGLAASVEGRDGTGRGGNIDAQFGSLTLRDGGLITARTTGPGAGGAVQVNAAELTLRSGAYISASTFAAGAGGSVSVNAPNLLIDGEGAPFGGGIFASSEKGASAAGGSVSVQSETLDIRRGGAISVQTFGRGDSGSVTLQTRDLTISRGGLINASTAGAGHGGNLQLTAQRVTIDGRGTPQTGIIADSQTARSGVGGSITLNAAEVVLTGGTISAITASAQRGGGIAIHAGEIALNAGGQIAASTSGSGQGGAVSLTADLLSLQPGSAIMASTTGSGKGGDVLVNAKALNIRGGSAPTGIFADSRIATSGDGGSIKIDAGQVALTQGGKISARTAGAGKGGDIDIKAENLALKNRASINTSASGSGIAGGIRFRVGGSLLLRDGSSVATTSSQSNAGLIDVRAGGSVRLEDSSITVQASLGDAGQIAIRTPKRIELKRSGIIAEAGGSGGNITIDASALGLDAGLITANAVAGDGGLITLNFPATGVLGDPGDFVIVSDFVRQSADSRITASSEVGLQGALLIRAPELDLSNAVEGFTASLVDASTQLREQCARRLGLEFSSFLVIGRGGISLTPDEPLADTPPSTGKEREKARVAR